MATKALSPTHGWRLILKATVADEGGVKFFVLEGTPGPVPEGLLLPGETRKDGSVVK